MTRRTTVLVTVLLLAVASCSSESSGSDSSDIDPTTSFTGSSCDYLGPSQFGVNTTVVFKFTNDSDVTNVGFAVMNLEMGDAEDAAIAGTSPPTAVGSSRSFGVTFTEAGQHGVACYVLPGVGESDAREYVTEIEVTE